MAKKKIIGLVTLSLAGVMTLSSFASANDTLAKDTDAQGQPSISVELKSEKTDAVKNIFKSKYYFQNKNVLKSVLNLTDDELKTKLAEYDNNVYKLLEASGKVEEYKTEVLKLIKEKLDKAVSDGKMTQEKADEMYSKAEEAVKEFSPENSATGIGAGIRIEASEIGDKILERFEDFKDGIQFEVEGLQDKFGEAVEVFRGFRTEAREAREAGETGLAAGVMAGLRNNSLADILGISEEELKTKLVEHGGNVYKLLEEAGKVEEYKSALLKMTKDSLDKAVAEGRITQEEADSMYAKSEETINNFDGESITMFIRPAQGDSGESVVFKRDRKAPEDTTDNTAVPTTQNKDI